MEKKSRNALLAIIVVAFIGILVFTPNGTFSVVTGNDCVVPVTINGDPITSYSEFNEYHGLDLSVQELNDAGITLQDGIIVEESRCAETIE